MLLYRLYDLGIEGAPFIGCFFLKVLVNGLRQPKIKPDYGLCEITLLHIPVSYCYVSIRASLDMTASYCYTKNSSMILL